MGKILANRRYFGYKVPDFWDGFLFAKISVRDVNLSLATSDLQDKRSCVSCDGS